MTEYDDRLREVERYKAKFKENKQLVNDTRKTSKALANAIHLKDENFESLKRRNGENVSWRQPSLRFPRLNGSWIMDEYRQKGEAFVLTVDPSSDDDFDNKASINEQSQESEDGLGDAEEGGDGDGVHWDNCLCTKGK
ncbi:unnamed protein product [Malus baccata var. baccata]